MRVEGFLSAAAHLAANTAYTPTRKTVTFTGAAGAGAVGTVALFTVTGRVLIVALTPICTTLLTEAAATATIALGVTGNTAVFIAATNAVDIDQDEIWVDTTPGVGAEALPAALRDVPISASILATVGAQNINGGVIEFNCLWIPLSSGATLVAA